MVSHRTSRRLRSILGFARARELRAHFRSASISLTPFDMSRSPNDAEAANPGLELFHDVQQLFSPLRASFPHDRQIF